ncbi:uncharacterized protein Z518_10213 [Rhinocladiella mackenziei CBS 650.93]|uniref:Uncharacterized protein n=1 Tax=Rhinocladiella mackenziei CBS 650.93 TaxID=1442369 RepID=A0A0D2FGL6_9EURO|nr:uncharacterized protein Z518_10213 [Rhinocladiella mackenziei CBS 650.93]KIX01147.1 hypothetical protein Z518_10213 [Rhinocladiella mackenziei CBS 650.93]
MSKTEWLRQEQSGDRSIQIGEGQGAATTLTNRRRRNRGKQTDENISHMAIDARSKLNTASPEASLAKRTNGTASTASETPERHLESATAPSEEDTIEILRKRDNDTPLTMSKSYNEVANQQAREENESQKNDMTPSRPMHAKDPVETETHTQGIEGANVEYPQGSSHFQAQTSSHTDAPASTSLDTEATAETTPIHPEHNTSGEVLGEEMDWESDGNTVSTVMQTQEQPPQHIRYVEGRFLRPNPRRKLIKDL